MKHYRPKSLYELFDEATKLLEKGWVQGSFKNDDGVCLVGAVEAVAPENIKLQYDMFYVIAQELKSSWTYRKIAKANDDSDETFIRRNIYLWNDCSFRKEKTVLKIMRNIRDREEKKFISSRVEELELEISVLKEQIDKQKQKIESLELENRTLIQKLIKSWTLREDKEVLDKLEDELSKKWVEFMCLPESVA